MKLYINYDGESIYEVSTHEPVFINGVLRFSLGEIMVEMCATEAEKIFPKLRRIKDEFLEITVKQGSVWGPAE